MSGAAAVAAIGLVSQLRGANLLSNPSFEAGTFSGQTSSDAPPWVFQLDCQRASFFHHPPSGSWSAWMKTFEPLGGGVTQNVNVVGGTSYNLSAFTLFEAGYSLSASTIQMGMIWLDNSNNPVGTPTALNIDPTSNPPTGVWNSFSISGAAPVNATQVMVSLGWSGGQVVMGQSQSAFFDDVDLEGAGTPPTGDNWFVDGSGDWNVPGNWSSGNIPNGVDAAANLGNKITANHTVFTDIGITLGTLNFNNANMYVVAGAGTLTMQVSAGSAQIIVQQPGTQKLNLPTTIASNTVLNVVSGANLIIADPITINSGVTLTQTAGSTVTYQSIINVLGSAGIVFGNSSHAHELDIAATGTASIGGTSSVLTVDSLSNSGKLDVKNNTLLVAYGSGANPSSTIKSQLTSGYNGGVWNGTGINTSMSTPRIGVGWKDITASQSVKVKYTYYGDANVDGTVNSGDFTSLAQNFNASAANAIWANGDFNYDGKVNALDFNALASNFGAAPIPTGGLGTLVPEPASALMLIPLASLVAAHRRRGRV
jgi:hypothetical protein